MVVVLDGWTGGWINYWKNGGQLVVRLVSWQDKEGNKCIDGCLVRFSTSDQPYVSHYIILIPELPV